MARIARKSADAWFAEYGESHQDHTNELIHWVCVPVIFACVLGFIRSIPVPAPWRESVIGFNWAFVAIALAWLFYAWLSPALCAGMLGFMALCYVGLTVIQSVSPWPLWHVCAVAFVLAWIGQFIGHRIEGKKPSFFKDVIFLLIGPAWLMSFVYRKMGVRY